MARELIAADLARWGVTAARWTTTAALPGGRGAQMRLGYTGSKDYFDFPLNQIVGTKGGTQFSFPVSEMSLKSGVSMLLLDPQSGRLELFTAHSNYMRISDPAVYSTIHARARETAIPQTQTLFSDPEGGYLADAAFRISHADARVNPVRPSLATLQVYSLAAAIPAEVERLRTPVQEACDDEAMTAIRRSGWEISKSTSFGYYHKENPDDAKSFVEQFEESVQSGTAFTWTAEKVAAAHRGSVKNVGLLKRVLASVKCATRYLRDSQPRHAGLQGVEVECCGLFR